ncbi:MAG: HipA N-terminal domain-containing protein [Spirosomataceae bacterium]|jgi:serine/threonine-protein kinase HipA
MNRKAIVWLHGEEVGVLEETDAGYEFKYLVHYQSGKEATPVSKTLPLSVSKYQSKVLFPFFDGLIPEGWLLDIAVDNWKVSERDRFGLLLTCCQNTIGAVSVMPFENEEL